MCPPAGPSSVNENAAHGAEFDSYVISLKNYCEPGPFNFFRISRIETGQVDLAVEQMVQRMLERAGQQLPLQVHRKKSRAGVDVFVTCHLLLQNIVDNFDLDIWFGSRHDADMDRLFLQLR